MLIKHIAKIEARFSPLDRNARSLRAFLTVMDTTASRAANARFKLNTTVDSRIAAPSLLVTYSDSTTKTLETRWMDCQEIVKAVSRPAARLLLDEEIRGSG